MTTNFLTASKLFFALSLFTIFTGARGCTVEGGSYETYRAPPTYVEEEVVVVTTSGTVSPALYLGDIALTVYAPDGAYSLSESFMITVREGGAFGPVVLSGDGFVFDGHGVAAVDLLDMAYGYYDVEIVGFDVYGDTVSYAAVGMSVQESLTSVFMDLESTLISGDVVMEIYEPDGGSYAAPIDTIDYAVWEIDPATGDLIFVEEMFGLVWEPWNPPVIGSLELADYYIETFAYDAYGYPLYEFGGEFSHVSNPTYVPMHLWYTQ